MSRLLRMHGRALTEARVIGFVYIIVNDYMPGIYKIGCTERSPHERAAELSKPTGVPAPFEVLCYIEVEHFQAEEQALHTWLGDFRISNNREFFEGGLHCAVGWMWHHRSRLSFTPVPDHERGNCPLLSRSEFEHLWGAEFTYASLQDPWAPPPEPAAAEVAAEAIAKAAATPDGDDDSPFAADTDDDAPF